MTKDLLLFWWTYYGTCIYTHEEFEKFSALIDKYGAEKITEFFMAACINDNGSPAALLFSIRKNKVDEMLATLPDVSKFDKEEKFYYEQLKSSFEKQIETAYNNVSIAHEIKEKIRVIIRSAILPKKYKRKRTSFKHIVKVRFNSCNYYFDLRKLKKYEQDISYIFDNVKSGRGSLYNLSRLKDDFIWDENLKSIFNLLLIGLATGHIKYTKNYLRNVPCPYIICN